MSSGYTATADSEDQIIPESPAAKVPWWKEGLDWFVAFVRTPVGLATTITLLAFCFAFAQLFRILPFYWFQEDSYYSHGPLIPFIAGYILYDRREKLANIPIKSAMPWAILLIPAFYLVMLASRTGMAGQLSYLFLFSMVISVVAIAGWRLAIATLPGTLYFIFMLPFGRGLLDKYTAAFQHISTDITFNIIKLTGLSVLKLETNQILVGNYTLYVAAACSGLHLLLAMTAFMVFFVLIGRLAWYKNLFLFAIILPLCLLINGLRVAMIGMVGAEFGDQWGAKFHDWSGYLSIVICFLILMKITRALGWK